jgi:hypothetical protein
MSLPARQERILGRIEHSLYAGDPRLRSMFATFTKLTRGQEMPRLEQLESRLWPLRYWRQRLTRRRREGRAASSAGSTNAPGVRMRAILLVPVMLAALAAAVFLGLGGSTPHLRRAGPGPACRCGNHWRTSECHVDDSIASREAGPRRNAVGRSRPWAAT